MDNLELHIYPHDLVDTSTIAAMSLDNIISSIDSEIARLQNVRDLLAEVTTVKDKAAATPRKRRTLSPAARKRISGAQRERLAKTKKAT